MKWAMLAVTLGSWVLLSDLGVGIEEPACLPGGVSFVTQADLDGDGLAEIVVGTVAQEAGPWRYGEEFLTYFFLPTLSAIQDIDGDGLPEVILVWLEEHWWPTAVRPFAVLQYDRETTEYEMAIDTRAR